MASPVPEVTRICVRGLRRSLQQARSFSSTTRYRKNGPLSVFPPTSNTELDAILDSLQTTVFMPAHLKGAQRHLVYRKAWQRYLTGEEPIRVALPVNDPANKAAEGEEATETFTLRPLNRLKDEPDHTKTFNRVLDLLRETPGSWSYVMPAFLRELHVAGRIVKPHQMEKLIRRAGEAGKLGLLVQCLQRVDDLGLKVSSQAIASRLVLAAHQRAARVGFGLGGEGTTPTAEELAECRTELDRAIKNVNAIMLLIQDRRHVPIDRLEDDPKRCPELYGAAMALIAIRRLLYLRENSPERVAARQEAARLASANASEEAAANDTATEETEAGAVSTEAQSHEEGSPEVLFPLGEADLPRLEEYAARMLELSDRANLEFNAESRNDIQNHLKRWYPAWFGVNVAIRAIPGDSQLSSRLKAAFEADINPGVLSATEALDDMPGGYEEWTLQAAYLKCLEDLKQTSV